jgi:AhpD family alkylhydroperoxidase
LPRRGVTFRRSPASNGYQARIGRAAKWQETTMAMTKLDKELVAVAISVAAGCRPCTTYHLDEATRAGASETAIEKAVAAAVCVRTGATEGMRRHALGLEPEQDGCGCASTDALAELISLGASLAVNCTTSVDKHLAAARALDVPREHVNRVFALVEQIRPVAIGHASARLGEAVKPPQADACAEASAKCC